MTNHANRHGRQCQKTIRSPSLAVQSIAASRAASTFFQMSDRHGHARAPRTRLGRISGRLLWVLAALLGSATVVTAAAIIHDTGRRRIAAQLIARATAEQVVTLASERLTVTALSHFGVAAHLPRAALEAPGVAVTALAGVQRQLNRMGRTDLLDASTYFRFDPRTKRLDVEHVEDDTSATPPSAILEELAIAAANGTQAPRRFTIHVATDPRLSDRAVLTAVDFDPTGAPIAVNGLVTQARGIARLLFARTVFDPPVVDTTIGQVRLDTASLEVRTADGRAIFGSVKPDDSRFLATIRPIGPLEGLTVTVAITRSQIPHQLIAFAPEMELWHLGLLLVCTTLVIMAAAGAARRELALARARSDFIAGVSHDLRMPLAQILLAGETLTMHRERDAGERERLTTSIVREAKRLISLVENVLLFSRSGAVKFTPKLEPLSVQALFDEVVDGIHLAVEDAGQRIEVDVSPDLAVLADRQLVRQALVNLVDNALKYGERGTNIWLRALGQPNGTVRLFVDDEGPGIPAAERARVFEAYERLARDQASERTGSGLGLAVVRHIARLCGGDAWIEEASPRGTRAVIELRASSVPQRTRETSGVA